MYDRENAFIIDDSPKMGNLCRHGEILFKDSNTGVSVLVTAVSMRERGTKKFAKIPRFVFALPCSFSELFKCWVAAPRSVSL